MLDGWYSHEEDLDGSVMKEAVKVWEEKVEKAKEAFRMEKEQSTVGEEYSEGRDRMARARELMEESIADADKEKEETIAAALDAERVNQGRRFEGHSEASIESDKRLRMRNEKMNEEIRMRRKAAARKASELAEANARKVKNADIAWAEKNRFRVKLKPEPTTTAPSTLSRFKGMLGLGGRTRKRKHRSRSKKTKTIQRRRKSYARKSTNKRRRPHKRFTRRY